MDSMAMTLGERLKTTATTWSSIGFPSRIAPRASVLEEACTTGVPWNCMPVLFPGVWLKPTTGAVAVEVVAVLLAPVVQSAVGWGRVQCSRTVRFQGVRPWEEMAAPVVPVAMVAREATVLPPGALAAMVAILVAAMKMVILEA